ncbi:serine/threonine protein kinase [Pelomyxa schiedti]|nr:serine/threonine protein kinase [Pelomyxa schiedti]
MSRVAVPVFIRSFVSLLSVSLFFLDLDLVIQCAETGDEQLARAFDSALASIYADGSYDSMMAPYNLADSITFYECAPVTDAFVFPDEPVGVLEAILENEVVVLGARGNLSYGYGDYTVESPVGPAPSLEREIYSRIGMFYIGRPINVTYMLNFDTLDEVFDALENGLISATTCDYGAGTFSQSGTNRASLIYRASCTTFGQKLYMASNYLESQAELYHSIETMNRYTQTKVGAVSQVLFQAIQELFMDAVTILFENDEEAFEALRTDSALLAIAVSNHSQSEEFKWIPLNYILPRVSFFRLETPEEEKVSSLNDTSVYDTGNSGLLEAYDASILWIVNTQKQDEIFNSYNLTVLSTGDCVAKPGAFVTPYPEGTLQNIINSNQLRIGAPRVNARPLLDTEAAIPTGAIPDIERAVATYLSHMFITTEPIMAKYTIFDTEDEVFDALRSGSIDTTSAFLLSARYSAEEPSTQEFASSCYTSAIPLYLYTLMSSPLESLQEITQFLSENAGYKVGATGEANCEIMATMFGTWATIIDFTTSEEAIDELFSDPFMITVLPYPLSQLPPNCSRILAPFIFPTCAFFRRDKALACGDGVVDIDFGENCDALEHCIDCTCSALYKPDGDVGCMLACGDGVVDQKEECDGGHRCSSNCVCETGYVPTSPPSKSCKVSAKDWYIPLIVVCFCALVVVGTVAAALIVKRRTKPRPHLQLEPVGDAASLRKLVCNDNTLPLNFSVTSITFGTNLKPLQVEAGCEEVLNITNTVHESVTLTMKLPAASHKFILSISPLHVVIGVGETVKVVFSIRAKCTADINLEIPLSITNCPYQVVLPLVAAVQLSSRLDIDEIQVGAKIGQGAAGSVFRATWRGLDVALKTFPVYMYEDNAFREMIEREIDLCVLLKSPNVVTFYGSSMSPTGCFIVMEFVELGSLEGILEKHTINWWLKLRFIKEIAQGVTFLHCNRVIHRDLKPANVLVSSLAKKAAHHIKLSDFGSARVTTENKEKGTYTVGVGTPSYTAPEILDAKTYSTKADVYSFALLIWSIATNTTPFLEIESTFGLFHHVIGGGRPAIPTEMPPGLTDLMTACWANNPDERPDFPAIVTAINDIIEHAP